MIALDPVEAAATPALLRRPAWFVGGFLVFSAIGLPIVPWQQAVSGRGKIVAYSPVDREQVIEAPVVGRIVTWHVLEGQHVRAGDPIVELTDIDPNFVSRLQQNRDAAQRRLGAAEDEATAYTAQEGALRQAQRVTLEAAALKVKMAEQKVAAMEQALEAERANLHTVDLNLQRHQQLFADGLSSKRDLELAELAHAKAQTEVNKAEASVSEAQALQMSLEAERLQKGSEAEAKISETHAKWQNAAAKETKAREALNDIEADLSRQSFRLVKAPREGTILHVVGSEGGQVVKMGEQLAVLVPNTNSRAVEMWVDGNDAPLLTAGRKVRLQFEGWPAVQFVGWPQVAVGTFGGEVAVVDSLSRRQGKFRVLVRPDLTDEPWPEPSFLRQGIQAKGWVLLNQVPLGYEVWRQLNGFPVSLPEAPAEKTAALSMPPEK